MTRMDADLREKLIKIRVHPRHLRLKNLYIGINEIACPPPAASCFAKVVFTRLLPLS